jgi:hypothetical protein
MQETTAPQPLLALSRLTPLAKQGILALCKYVSDAQRIDL